MGLLRPKCRTWHLALLNLMPLAFSPSIQPVQIPLQRLSTLKQVDTPTQLGVICKLSEGAFHPLVQCRLPCSLPQGGSAWDSVPTSPQGAEICLAGHPREEISRGRLNFSLVSLPRDGLQPSLPSGCCPGLSVETSAEHVPLGRAKDGPAEEGVLASLLVAPPGSWNCPVLMAQQTQKMQLMLEEVARLRAEISSVKQVLRRVGKEAWLGRSPWGCGCVGLLTAVSQPLPQGPPGLHRPFSGPTFTGRFRQRRTPLARQHLWLLWLGSSGRGGTQARSRGASHRWQGLSPPSTCPGECGGWGRGCGDPHQPTSGPWPWLWTQTLFLSPAAPWRGFALPF
ncbi:uncharacterized protein LOC128901081 isoform X4 [Rissa tridactyla]|uniref:uncharacterized protein LOC128901081 isoform X4 n=1 Tax=Rissa tridactyla TaxID=75485 RepID=UPI0023BA4A5F|nr:uncharacterized protein LOC128901081 isoform X4 [Rissa tridactyla]